MENHVVYLCEDTPDGIFTAIYDLWNEKLPREQFSIQPEQEYELCLFTEYRYIQTDFDKAVKVIRSVRQRIGIEVCDWVYRASLSYEQDKIDYIYDFLKLAFRYGKDVTSMHGIDTVCRIFEYRRNIWNETHLFQGFVRFHEIEGGIMVSRIHPKNQVLPLLAEHFSDRFPQENFVILDDTHNMGLFHQRNSKWYIAPLEKEVLEEVWNREYSAEYEKLWKTFFHTIAIRERENYKCQRNLCAIRYRDYMVEFQG